MRYIIDAAVLQAELLNRTLVLPSFVYARACEYYMYVIVFLPSNSVFYDNFSWSCTAPFVRTSRPWSTKVTR